MVSVRKRARCRRNFIVTHLKQWRLDESIADLCKNSEKNAWKELHHAAYKCLYCVLLTRLLL